MKKKTAFQPPAWAHTTNIYEVNLRQYTPEGSFDAFAAHLPRLADMGVETLWFMPIHPISLRERQGTLGSYYAIADYRETNPEYGNVADFRQLTQQAHELGMKVIIDWVANHTGWDHVWTSEHRDFYRLDEEGNFTERNGWHDVIDLDYDNPALRQAMIDCMAFWVETCDIDGFRCDMAHLVPLDFWQEARRALDALKPLFWLAETEEASYHPTFDCSYTWEWMHATKSFVEEGKSVIALDRVLYRYQDDFPPGSMRLFFTSNHDENSWNGTEYEKYGDAALPLAVFSATWNGIPLIYSGQELPNRKRLAFFEKDPIEWTHQPELHDFYKTLLTLRKKHPALRTCHRECVQYRIHLADEQVFAFLRISGERQVLVLLNFSAETKSVLVHDHRVHGLFHDAFSGRGHSFDVERRLEISGWSWIVLQR